MAFPRQIHMVGGPGSVLHQIPDMMSHVGFRRVNLPMPVEFVANMVNPFTGMGFKPPVVE